MIWRSVRDTLRYRQFRYQFGAQAISVVGSALSPVALSLGILQLTGSSRDLSIVLAASSVPTVLMLLVGGVWSDRISRQLILVVTSAICGVAQVCLGVMFIAGRFDLWLAALFQVITGVALAFYFPATTGLTVQTVPSEGLQNANALLSLTRSISGSVGPLLGGLLVLTAGAGWALVADGLSFFVCALLLSRLRLKRLEKAAEGERFLQQLAQGFREVISRSWVWSSIVAFMFTNVATAVLLVLGPVLALSGDNGVVTWSLIVASVSAGQVIGDVAALRIVPRRPIVASRFLELLVVPLLVALALGAPIGVLIGTGLLAGVATSFPDALWFTALQRNLPPNVLSRVSSYDWMGSLALRPIGYLGAAAIGAALGAGPALAVAAAAVIATRAACLVLPGTWQVTSVPMVPHAAPSTEPESAPVPSAGTA